MPPEDARMTSTDSAPPPPPPPPIHTGSPINTDSPVMPTAGEPRNALLESIRSSGGVHSLRSTPTERSPRLPAAPLTPGNSLASSLIAALNDRKRAIESADSDSGSDWDD
ncbi:hypothetical protein BY458DRAFT_510376 [Sporodiniella umbellata]|nr:hypothetical protein BY458DRAFT_510376 [Sporodiniella umbellata]